MFLNMISPSLKLEVTQSIYLKSMQENSLFAGKPQLINFLTKNMEAMLFMPEDLIIKQGEEA